jgi:thiamine biosynthesis lipoprotein
MGTTLQIKIWDELPRIIQEKIKLEILDYTYNFDNTYSRFKDNNLIVRIAEKSGKFTVPKEFTELLEIYKTFFQITNGIVNPLIGNTISDLGYDAKYSLKKKNQIRETPNFLTTLKIVNETEIETTKPVLIDFGAIGKGFWVEKIKKILDKNNLKHYMINGSGDIYFKNARDDNSNSENLKVGLEGLNSYVELENGESICGSGTDKRNWSIKEKDNLHHIINANTGIPSSGILSVWVKCKNTAIADGLTTCLFFMDPKLLQNKFKFEYLIIFDNKKITQSENFNSKLVF